MFGGVLWTRVHAPVVLRHQVDVVKHEAVERPLPAGLGVTHVHQGRPVEGLVARLLDDEYPVVELLPLEDRVHVAEEKLQVLLAVPAKKMNIDLDNANHRHLFLG